MKEELHRICVKIYGGQHEECKKEVSNHPHLARVKSAQGYTPLHVAAYYGQVKACGILASHMPSVDLVTDDGWTPLHYAALRGHNAVIDFLIGRGASIVKRTRETSVNGGWTPLHLAISGGHVSAVRRLAAAGGVESTLHFTCYPFYDFTKLNAAHYAILRDDAELLSFLLQQHTGSELLDGRWGEPVCFFAARSASTEILRTIINLYPECLTMTDGRNLSIADHAMVNPCWQEIVVYLSEQNAVGPSYTPSAARLRPLGVFPMHNSVWDCDIDKLRFLVGSKGLRGLGRFDLRGRSPLAIAILDQNIDMINEILQLDASLMSQAVYRSGETGVDLVCWVGDLQLCERLLNWTTPSALTRSCGNPPLWYAAHRHHSRVMDWIGRQIGEQLHDDALSHPVSSWFFLGLLPYYNKFFWDLELDRRWVNEF